MGTVLIIASALLAAAAARDLSTSSPGRLLRRAASRRVASRLERLTASEAGPGMQRRIERAGLSGRMRAPDLVGAKLAAALAAGIAGVPISQLAPGRLSPAFALAMPIAGFLSPDAWLELRTRRRHGEVQAALPDVLELIAVAASAGREPVSAFDQLGGTPGALHRELAAASADRSCGVSRRESLARLRRRLPGPEVAAMCAAFERSSRHGSPLADLLRQQAAEQRAAERRRVAERAARAAPKIQLAVALLLVPSVLLMIAAALLANLDGFLAGL